MADDEFREGSSSDLIPVRLGPRTYEIHVGAGVLGDLGRLTGSRTTGRQAFLVTDTNVGPLMATKAEATLRSAGFSVATRTVPAGEATKSLRSASLLYDWLVEAKADRKAVVVALGGGVVGDLAGFVAATYARGVAFVQVPTTLLAMVDASVGGKVAVDHPRAKNMIGAFHQPALVACDLDAVRTLPEREFRCGLAEVVKHGVILDADLFAFCETASDRIVRRETSAVQRLVVDSCRIKARVVERDERETSGLRAVLNYGHTFAHAFETAGGYCLLHHGEAVAIGMICAGMLAERLGRVDARFDRCQRALWEKLGLPTELPKELLRHPLVDIMRSDKKAQAGRLRFILPDRIGQVDAVDGVEESLVAEVLRAAASGPAAAKS